MNKKVLLWLFCVIQISAQNKIVLSIPKCGTHLLANCVFLLTNKRPHWCIEDWVVIKDRYFKNESLLAHALPIPTNIERLKAHSYKGVLIIRDPRDEAVSMAYFATTHTDMWPWAKNRDVNDLIMAWTRNTSLTHSSHKCWSNSIIHQFGDITDLYQRYLLWHEQPFIYIARFEKLVGPSGGGTREEQMQEIKNIAQHLKIEFSDEKIEDVADKVFEPSVTTFRNGKIGSWRDHFSSEMKEEFKKIAGQLLIDLGYEKDYEW